MVNVCVVGAAGGIGQPLSLLLATKLPAKSTLSLYDVGNVMGVAADLSHIDSDITIRAEQGKVVPNGHDPALSKISEGVDVFVIVAGVPRKPGMTRDDLFKVNASIVFNIVQTTAKVSPNACYCIVTNPVNAVVPIAAQVLKKLGIYNKDKLFGVSTLDVIRANRFVNNERAPFPNQASVPVVGGHSDITIVPLFSQLYGPSVSESAARLNEIAVRVQNAGTEVVKAKAGAGSATLSMAYAGATFALTVVDALTGKRNPLVYSYVDTAGTQPVSFLAIPLLLGTTGIVKRYPIGPVTAAEQKLLDAAFPAVKKNISEGESFARSKL